MEIGLALFTTFAIVMQPTSGQTLIITGFGVVKYRMFFIELYATRPIGNLGIYSIHTNATYRLPSRSVDSGFLLLSNVQRTNIFFGNVYPNFIGDIDETALSLNNGDDGIAVVSDVTDLVVDYFGPNRSHTAESCECSYRFGWGKRLVVKSGVDYRYNRSEWALSPTAMDNCKGKNNTDCRRPFPVKEVEGYLTNLSK